MKEGCIYIPERDLRREIIHLYYDTPVKELREKWKIAELVTRNYWWPGVTREIRRYIDRCDACQWYKNRSKALAEKLMLNAIPEKL